jgi:hypothetical protein
MAGTEHSERTDPARWIFLQSVEVREAGVGRQLRQSGDGSAGVAAGGSDPIVMAVRTSRQARAGNRQGSCFACTARRQDRSAQDPTGSFRMGSETGTAGQNQSVKPSLHSGHRRRQQPALSRVCAVENDAVGLVESRAPA